MRLAADDVARSLRGSWHLMTRGAEALPELDLTRDGFWRSFLAFALMLPATLVWPHWRRMLRLFCLRCFITLRETTILHRVCFPVGVSLAITRDFLLVLAISPIMPVCPGAPVRGILAISPTLMVCCGVFRR